MCRCCCQDILNCSVQKLRDYLKSSGDYIYIYHNIYYVYIIYKLILTVYSHRWRASQLGMIWITLYINSLVVFWIWHALLFVADCSDRIWLTHDLPWLAPFPSQCLKVQGFPSIRKQCQHQLWKVAPILDGNQRQSNLPHTNLALTHHHFRKTANIFIESYTGTQETQLHVMWPSETCLVFSGPSMNFGPDPLTPLEKVGQIPVSPSRLTPFSCQC